MMNNGTRIMRLRRRWPPKARTAAALVTTVSLALAVAASTAYGSPRFSASVHGSKARESAQAQSKHKKVPPGSGNETPRQAAQDYAQLLGWAKCMRHRGYPRMPDPKRGTPQPNGRGGTVLGWGAAYLEVPEAYDAYSQAFQNKAKTCGIDPVTSEPHH